MGNTQSEFGPKTKKLTLEIIPYFHDKRDKELVENMSGIIIQKKDIFKKYFINILKNAFESMNATCHINPDNIFINIYKNKDEFINVQTIIVYDDNKRLLTDDMIYFSIIHKIHESKSIEIERNIYLKFQENDVLNLIIN